VHDLALLRFGSLSCMGNGSRARLSQRKMRDVQGWVSECGYAGERYSAYELARCLGVQLGTVLAWIRRGWLQASLTTYGYRIRRRSIRRLLADYPSAATTVIVAQARYWRKWRAANGCRSLADEYHDG
jgi:hypothetical protein